MTLDFLAGSIFTPSWKVEKQDDWSDTRILSLMNLSDEFPKEYPEGKVIAVRPDHFEDYQVYFNRFGIKDGSRNEFSRLVSWSTYDPTFVPSDLSMSAWRMTYDQSALANAGIAVSCNPSTGEIHMEVTDTELLLAHSGEEYPLTLTLYPGERQTVFTLRLMDGNPDIEFPEETYMGMKTRVKTVNMLGEPRVSAPDPQTVFKTENTLSAPYIGTEPVPVSREFDIYAYGSKPDTELSISSDDPFNDGDMRLAVNVYKPTPSRTNDILILPVDGTEVNADVVYKDRNGKEIRRDRFDDDVYSQILSTRVDLEGAPSYIRRTDDGRQLYLYWTDEADIDYRDSTLYYRPGMSGLDSLGLGHRIIDYGRVNVTPVNPDVFSFNYSCPITTKIPDLGPMNITVGTMYNTFGNTSHMGIAMINNYGCETEPHIEYTILEGSDGSFDIDPYYRSGSVVYSYGVDSEWALSFYNSDSHNTLNLPYGRRKIGIVYSNKHSHQMLTAQEQEFTVEQDLTFRYCPFTVGGAYYIAVRPPLCAWVYKLWADAGLPLSATPYWDAVEYGQSFGYTMPGPYTDLRHGTDISAGPSIEAPAHGEYILLMNGDDTYEPFSMVKVTALSHLDDGDHDPHVSGSWGFTYSDPRYGYVHPTVPFLSGDWRRTGVINAGF